jgi:hypothetical protein
MSFQTSQNPTTPHNGHNNSGGGLIQTHTKLPDILSVVPIFLNGGYSPPLKADHTPKTPVRELANDILKPVGKSWDGLGVSEQAGMTFLLMRNQHIFIESHFPSASPADVARILLSAVDPATDEGHRFAAFVQKGGDQKSKE